MDNEKTRIAWLSVVSNSVLVTAKLLVGMIMGSVSVISEAIHSGIDLLAAIIALFAVRQSSQPADEDHPYGHGKFENVSGTIEAILIFLAAIWIIMEAVHKLRNPGSIEAPGWGVALMLISAIVNIVVSNMLFRVGKRTGSVALEADAWHLRTDVYTSLGVMGGLLIIWIVSKVSPSTNIIWIDPVVAIGVALLIIKASYDLTIQAGRDLFDISLPEDELKIIRKIVRDSAESCGIHHLRTRKSGSHRFIEFHMVVDPNCTVRASHDLTDDITKKIKHEWNDAYVNIHVEPCDKAKCSKACLKGCFNR